MLIPHARTTSPDFVDIGGTLRYLRHVEAGSPLGGPRFVLSNLDRLRHLLESTGMLVSTRLFDSQLAQVVSMLKLTPDKTLSDLDASRIHDGMERACGMTQTLRC
jgi:hypothetical protein